MGLRDIAKDIKKAAAEAKSANAGNRGTGTRQPTLVDQNVAPLTYDAVTTPDPSTLTPSKAARWLSSFSAIKPEEVRNYFDQDARDARNKQFEDYFASQGRSPNPISFIQPTEEGGISTVTLDPNGGYYTSDNMGGHTVHPGVNSNSQFSMQVSDVNAPMNDGRHGGDILSLTSPWITGTELQRQQQAGLIDMPYEEIDPSLTYNVADLNRDWGYVGYDPNAASRFGYAMNTMYQIPNGAIQAVENSRETAGAWHDYTMYVNGQPIDGKSFDGRSTAYEQQIAQIERENGGGWSKPLDPETSTMYVPLTVYADVDGNIRYSYGIPSMELNGDGTITISFSDGTAGTAYENDVLDNGEPNIGTRWVPITNPDGFDMMSLGTTLDEDGNIADVRWIPNMVLEDGTQLRYDEVEAILGDRRSRRLSEWREGGVVEDPIFGNDTTISYEGFKPLWDLPTNEGTQFLEYEDPDNKQGLKLRLDAGTLPMLWDMFSTSAPFLLPTGPSVGIAATRAPMAAYGIDTFGYDNSSGGYRLTHPEIDENGNLYSNADERAVRGNMIATGTFPYLERLAGFRGVGPMRALTEKLKYRPFSRWLNTSVQEGGEEIVGNLWENEQRYGPDMMFGRVLRDSDGNVLRDIYGQPLLDPNTRFEERVDNFFDPAETGNAFLGGFSMGAILGAPSRKRVIADRLALQREKREGQYKDKEGNDRYAVGDPDKEREILDRIASTRRSDANHNES